MLIPGSIQSCSPDFSGVGSGNMPMQTPGLCWTVRFHMVGVDVERETETERGNQTDAERDRQPKTRAGGASGVHGVRCRPE